MKIQLLLAAALVAARGFAALGPLPGMPSVIDPRNIYSEDAANKFSTAVRNFPALVYVQTS
jgi:hypothetical protein